MLVRDWLAKDPHGLDSRNPLGNFSMYIEMRHNIDIRLWNGLTYSENVDFFDDDFGDSLPYGCVILPRLWSLRGKINYKILSWCIYQSKKARKIGKEWKKSSYYWR